MAFEAHKHSYHHPYELTYTHTHTHVYVLVRSVLVCVERWNGSQRCSRWYDNLAFGSMSASRTVFGVGGGSLYTNVWSHREACRWCRQETMVRAEPVYTDTFARCIHARPSHTRTYAHTSKWTHTRRGPCRVILSARTTERTIQPPFLLSLATI